jgi:hypothetical protein
MKLAERMAMAAGLCVVLAATLCAGQTKEWDRRFGGLGDDYAVGAAQLSDGRYVVAGSSASGISGDRSEASRGGYDYWVLVLDSVGVALSDYRYGGDQDDYLASLLYERLDGTNYIRLLGHTESGRNGDKTRSSYGFNDFWGFTFRLNANHTLVQGGEWEYSYGGTLDEFASSLASAEQLYALNGGSTQSPTNWFLSDPPRGGWDYLIGLTHVDGGWMNFWRYGGSGTDMLSSVDVVRDAEGKAVGAILAGTSDSPISGDKSQASRGGNDYWAVRVDTNGVKLWDRRFGGTGHDWCRVVRRTADGGFILGGVSGSGAGGDKTEASRGSSDYWVVKIDANGNKQWDRRFGGTGADELEDVVLAADGGYLLAGTSASSSGLDRTEASRGGKDYWIVKIDSDGSKQWDRRYGGSLDDRLMAAMQTADGGFLLTGMSVSELGGDKSQYSRGGYDYWVVKVSPAPSPIYRFWSPAYNGHFFTISASERDHINATWPDVWGYEGPAMKAHAKATIGTSPVYRFWSPSYRRHFFTISESEKNHIQATWPDVWKYEGVAWHAFKSTGTGRLPVHRFWSDAFSGHFYTISESEKNHILATWPDIWKYEGIAYYALPTSAKSGTGTSPETGSKGMATAEAFDALPPPNAMATAWPGSAAGGKAAPNSTDNAEGDEEMIAAESEEGTFFPLNYGDAIVAASVYDPAQAAWTHVLPPTGSPEGVFVPSAGVGRRWLAVLVLDADEQVWRLAHGSWLGWTAEPPDEEAEAILEPLRERVGLPVEEWVLPDASGTLTLRVRDWADDRPVQTLSGLAGGTLLEWAVPSWNRWYRLDVVRDEDGELVDTKAIGHLLTH